MGGRRSCRRNFRAFPPALHRGSKGPGRVAWGAMKAEYVGRWVLPVIPPGPSVWEGIVRRCLPTAGGGPAGLGGGSGTSGG